MKTTTLMMILAAAASSSPASASMPTVGIMYEGWHAPAVQAIEDCAGCAPPLTIEAVLRSNGTESLADAYATVNASISQAFHFHTEPLHGSFYCMYRKRASDAHGATGLRDCRGIPATAARHAALLRAANISFVVADSTNIQSDCEFGDAIQLRPFEVLAEEWHALRLRGLPTPQIAIWQNLQDPTGELWRRFVDGSSVYANASYGSGPGGSDLLLRDGRTGRPAFFTTADPDPTLVAQLEDPVGPYNVTTQVMWALRDNFDKGEMGFFSACTVPGKTGAAAFTTSVPAENAPGPCAQRHTTNAALGPRGTALTVGPSYQLSYSALPWRASGKLGGATLKAQFGAAFALRDELDYLFIGTFNEHIAQPQKNPYYATDAHALAMGLGDSGAGGAPDPAASQMWVDMYGDGVTRDLEPSVSDQGSAWALLSSCLRVLAAGAGCGGGSSSEEACCSTTDPAQRWRNVWSLALGGDASRDLLLTVDANELAVLTKKGSGGGWEEVCTPHGGASAFCAGVESAQPEADYPRGPFLLHAAAQVAPAAAPSNAVHRCVSTGAGAGGRHFVAGDGACYGRGRAESVLGFAASARDSNTPRSLRSCAEAAAGGAMYHSLDTRCAAGDEELGHLGFVH